MAYSPTPYTDPKTWDFIVGNIHKGMSISVDRHQWLAHLATLHDDLKLSFHDPWSNSFTKWKGFYTQHTNSKGEEINLMTAYDVHRSVLPNEIVVESDYKTYEENYDASRIIGAILESKGFFPHYYYSGSKSIHIHVFIDFKTARIDNFLQRQLVEKFKYKSTFTKKFMEWLRKLFITCWGTKAREFDPALVKSTHLIRAELSRNKLGFKTFIGYTHKDLSFVPYICNEENRIYPALAPELKLSPLLNAQELIEEFLAATAKQTKKAKEAAKSKKLAAWMNPEDIPAEGTLKGCVEFMLSDEFKAAGDGYQRAMFYLANELRKVHDSQETFVLLCDWSSRMGDKCVEGEIRYRCNNGKIYSLSHETIHSFLISLGVENPRRVCEEYAQTRSGEILPPLLSKATA